MQNLIITLGASAGGLHPLEAFFKSVGSEPKASFVIIQHLSPDYKSLMPELLKKTTSMPVHMVEPDMPIEAKQVYLIPPGQTMTIVNGRFKLTAGEVEKPPINIFMRSAAESYGDRAIGIIFSGTGSDGTEGASAIRDRGGLVIAQSLETAKFRAMPQSVIRRDISHATLTPGAMWPAIEKYTGDPVQFAHEFGGSNSATQNRPLETLGIACSELFEFLEHLYHLDFSCYKITSVSRRIQRRMDSLSIQDVKAYLKHLRKNKAESDALYRDLLICVTEFFRDPEVYCELADKVIEPVFSSKDPPAQYRIWVAGCATGEEAYSMAILTDELARKHNYNGQIIIFATDVHKGSIEYAGQGIYKKKGVATLNKDRLERYFDITPEGNFRIKMEIRQKVVFACHNLLVDPPFTRMDLVTCRNLLIYLKLDEQDSILRCFHYALRIKGHLLLGNSESISELENVFHTVSSRAKLFRKQSELDQSKRPHQLYARPKGLTTQTFKLPPPQPTSVSVERKLLEAYDLVLKRFAPAGVLITTNREVRHYFGGAAEYCSPTEGRANRDFLSMLEGDLRLAVSTTLQRVLSTKKALRSEGIACKTHSGNKVIDVSIIPYFEEDNDLQLLLITFEPRKKPDSLVETIETRGDFKADEETLNRIVMLEDELRSTKENLQAAVEELQSSNEELQAINEEIQISNEELQSTNEELYTMNTDLCTVNAELEQKNREILQLNKDHENLLANTEDGILYVDRELRVKQFNPAIAFAFNLLPQDIGRPIEHIAYKLENREEMLANVRTALETGLHSEHEFITSSGISYLRRVTPFKDDNHNITGAILTYTDITESSQMRSRWARAMRTAGMVWWEWDLQSDQLEVYASGDCILGQKCDNLKKSSGYWLSRVHPDDLKHVQESLSRCTDGPVDEWLCEHRYLNTEGLYIWVLETGLVSRRTATGRCLSMTGTTMDIHKRKMLELGLTQAKDRAEAALKAKASFLSTMSHEIRTPLNGVCGMAELLAAELKDESLSEYLDTITSSAKALLELINNILEYSKSEAGKLELLLQKHNLEDTIKDTLDVFGARIKEKKLNVRTDYELKRSQYIFDALRLKQVLMNLVGNAAKFTPDGGDIHIRVSALARNNIQFIIEDSGSGIDPEFQNELFQPFTQEDTSDTRHYRGTGLGLSISKQLVELMGGHIRVESKLGKGSSFIFNIKAEPTCTIKKVKATKPLLMPNKARRALIVDDDAANRLVMSKMLACFNFKTDTASSSEQALQRLSEKNYDIIFMDLQMPRESGYVLTKRIRNGQPNAAHKQVPIIAFTADASPDVRQQIHQVGFDEILVKPVNMQDISHLLEQISA